MKAEPCLDCKTTGGFVVKGEHKPRRTRNLCCKCYTRRRRAKTLGKVTKPAISTDAIEARNRLVEKNLPLVRYVVAKMLPKYRELDVEEADQEGYVGLILAAQRFDPSMGFKFSTFAHRTIYTSVLNLIYKKPGRKLHLSRESDCGEYHEALKAKSADSFEEIDLEPEASPENIDRMLRCLDTREREIVARRFGLDGRDPETLGAIGQSMGICKERVRQLQRRAMDVLQSAGGAA